MWFTYMWKPQHTMSSLIERGCDRRSVGHRVIECRHGVMWLTQRDQRVMGVMEREYGVTQCDQRVLGVT